jgi:glyoxylase-like metal-dependent hydrolase (beta-lactamase superfamily II)
MLPIAADVWQLTGFPRHMINAYLIGDVLIDAQTRWERGRLLRQLEGRSIALVALTHCHPDHQGAARAVCEQFGAPLACHEADVPAMEGRESMQPRNWQLRLSTRIFSGPPHAVGQLLHDGDQVAGFRVIHLPGHTPGHVIFFRESDRLAIIGDVLANIHFVTGRAGLREPPPFFSADPEEDRRSIRKLAELRPSTICFGHGPPLRSLPVLEQFAVQYGATGRVPATVPARLRPGSVTP